MFGKKFLGRTLFKRNSSKLISPQAIIAPQAELDSDVSVGAYSVIGEGVQIASGTWIGPHVVIKGPTKIGRDNKIYQFATLGEEPQSKSYQGEPESCLEIGDRNIIREYASLHRGTGEGGGITRFGNDNWLMAYCHIAHDCQVGNHTIFANNVNLGGHVKIEDYVNLGGSAVVHQFCLIGRHSFAGGNTGINKDVPPFIMVFGSPAKARGINKEGLKRRDFSSEIIQVLRQAYKIIYRKNLTTAKAIAELTEWSDKYTEVLQLVNFIQQSTRGIVR